MARRYMCKTSGVRLPRWAPACAAGCERCHIAPTPGDAQAEQEAPAAPAPRVTRSESVATEPMPDDAPVPLSAIPLRNVPRASTGLAPLDTVLGGGLAEQSFVVLAGVAGQGKSTAALQMLAGLGLRVLYATGEETREQVGDRAARIGANSPNISIVEESDLSAILRYADVVDAQVIAIDSIQTTYCDGANGGPGSASQVAECALRLMNHSKDAAYKRSVLIIGHVTADGSIAGPSKLRHFVDVVLDLDSGSRRGGNERVLRCSKNRFGAANAVGRFEMTAVGLVPLVDEPEPEDDVPRARIGAIGAELGDSVDGELPDTIANRLLRAAVRLADVVDAEADTEAIGGEPLAHLQRFGVATEALHEAAKTFAAGISEKDRRRLGT